MFIFLPLFLHSNSSSYTYTHTHSNFDPKLSPTIPLTTQSFNCKYIYTPIHRSMHTYIFVLNTCMDANIHTLAYTYICTYMYTCASTDTIQTYIHIYTQAHTHMRTCTDAGNMCNENTFLALPAPSNPESSSSASTFWDGRGQSQKLFDNFSFYLAWGFLRMTLTTYRKRDLFESL